jgi:hypothetical protein
MAEIGALFAASVEHSLFIHYPINPTIIVSAHHFSKQLIHQLRCPTLPKVLDTLQTPANATNRQLHANLQK